VIMFLYTRHTDTDIRGDNTYVRNIWLLEHVEHMTTTTQ